ncbi:DUF3097 domain-containing protein [Frigoribacterium sp. VKM Ac-2836]|nr:DUF3097 domain-containing protein [Frigoribacterium sp. VKM Ac-2836]
MLAGDWKRSSKPAPTPTDAVRDLVVEEVRSGFTGAIVRVEAGTVELEDWKGRVRAFPLTGSFLIDGAPVALRVPRAAPQGRARTASGSFAVENAGARVARQSRIFVEGRHDAELVEKVWGSDLRVEGVVVEYLEGVDHLADVLRDFRPGPERRVGVLVDHLVPGSKESRVAEGIARSPLGRHVLVVGHPFVDVWQAVKPGRLGVDAWPVVPRSVEWKHGVCEAMGWPHEDQADIARAWQHILSRVRSYADLEPSVLGRVEELIDFVTSG